MPEEKEHPKKEKRIMVVVIRPNLKYRIKGFKEGRRFVPNVGDKIPLPKDIAKLELNSKNVRLLLDEEKEELKKKKVSKKKKVATG